MLWFEESEGSPVPLRPKLPAPLWHSRQSVNTTGRRNSREFVEPCGEWHISHPSTRTGGCSNAKGPRLSEWHFRQASSFAGACATSEGRAAMRQVGANVPCGLWQSEHTMNPVFTGCLKGMEKSAFTFV